MSEENGTTEGSVTTPLGGATFKGKKAAEFITVLSLLLTAVLAALYWTHGEQTKVGFEAIAAATREQSIASKESAQATRYMACIIAVDQKDRVSVRGECREQARMP